jgi:hypothetical protein
MNFNIYTNKNISCFWTPVVCFMLKFSLRIFQSFVKKESQNWFPSFFQILPTNHHGAHIHHNRQVIINFCSISFLSFEFRQNSPQSHKSSSLCLTKPTKSILISHNYTSDVEVFPVLKPPQGFHALFFALSLLSS